MPVACRAALAARRVDRQPRASSLSLHSRHDAPRRHDGTSTSSRAAQCSSSGGHPASRSFVQRSERAAPHQADPWRAQPAVSEAEAGRVSASRAGGHAPRTGERVSRKSASRACFCVTVIPLYEFNKTRQNSTKLLQTCLCVCPGFRLGPADRSSRRPCSARRIACSFVEHCATARRRATSRYRYVCTYVRGNILVLLVERVLVPAA